MGFVLNKHIILISVRYLVEINKGWHLNISILNRNVESRTLSDGHTMQKLVPETLGHLSPSHMDYFIHWCLLLGLEQKASQKSGGLQEIWCMTGRERYCVFQKMYGNQFITSCFYIIPLWRFNLKIRYYQKPNYNG